jgi:altronate hydrolase
VTRPLVIRLAATDNVAVAVDDLAPGDSFALAGDQNAPGLHVRDAIPAGHKVSLTEIPTGGAIRRYGQLIGLATRDISPGKHVHTHNCSADCLLGATSPASASFGDSPSAGATNVSPTNVSATDLGGPCLSASGGFPLPATGARRTFQGYLRPGGRAGTRNYVAVISTVNCSGSAARLIAERASSQLLPSYPTIDGIVALTYKGGCTWPVDGEDHLRLERVIGGFARHPNVGACLLVGLGCEVVQATKLVEREGLAGRDNLGVLVIQEQGGLGKTVEAAVAALRELLPTAAAVERTELPASLLVLGTQCGGSDAFSGITANPALGVAADLLVAQGGTVVLPETPELFGAEHLLTRRAVRPEVAEALLERIRWWQWYAGVFGGTVDNNPTPGNKAGGITTIVEKSLGAVAKAGTTPLKAVYRYAEPVTEHGLVVMDTPGNDPVSLTGVVAGGANIIAFTTGRGSVYGCKPVPSLKIASTSALYRRLADDMDLDAGVILDGVPLEDVGRAIFEELLAVASGRQTKSEAQGLGDEEFAPWMVGPLL